MAYKIVVADPSASLQKIIQLSFPESEFELHFFEDGKQLIERLAEIKPDALLVRLSLPERDGYEVTSYLRNEEEFRQIPLILLKGLCEPLEKERLREFEYDEIICLPFDSQRLVEKVRELVSRKDNPPSIPEETQLLECLKEEDNEKKAKQGKGENKEEEGFYLNFPDFKKEIENKIREFLRKESLEIERELEKRVRTSLSAELKEWLREELGRIKKVENL